MTGSTVGSNIEALPGTQRVELVDLDALKALPFSTLVSAGTLSYRVGTIEYWWDGDMVAPGPNDIAPTDKPSGAAGYWVATGVDTNIENLAFQLNGASLDITDAAGTLSVDASPFLSDDFITGGLVDASANIVLNRAIGSDIVIPAAGLLDNDDVTNLAVSPGPNSTIAAPTIVVAITEGGATVSSNEYPLSGDDSDWYQGGTVGPPSGITDTIYTRGYVGVNGPASMAPKAPLQVANKVGSAGGQADFNATISSAQNDGFGNYDDYQVLLYESSSAPVSYGIGIESGSLVFNSGARSSGNWIGHRFGGSFISGVRGDGYERNVTYGQGAKNNGTPTAANLVDAQGWRRERPITDGNPRVMQSAYGGNWLWGGWSPVYTTSTGYIDRGWVEAFRFTAPELPDGFSGRTLDCSLSGNFGQKLVYQRECVLRQFFGWRVKINGVVQGQRASAVAHYDDQRTNLGNDTLVKAPYEPIGSFCWVRQSVPAGATLTVEFNNRHALLYPQTYAYGRFIAGVYRECIAVFLPSQTVVY